MDTSFAKYRNWVIVSYLLGTGNRISTVAALKIEDLNFEDMSITLRHVKNRKQQIVPMSTSLSRILTEYLTFRDGLPTDPLFCTVFGKSMSPDVLKDCVLSHNRSRGVSKTSAHLFRHTFAKHYIKTGGNIFVLQKLLGHSDLAMVRRYVEMFGEDLHVGFDSHNALDRVYKHGKYIRMKK
jgi:integrase/recombinase XerD